MDQVDVANDYLTDPGIYTVFQFAPAVRATLGEEFGFPAGVNVERKIVEALKKPEPIAFWILISPPMWLLWKKGRNC